MRTRTISLLILVLTLSVSTFAQKTGKTYYINGQVLDMNDKPVSGAMVLIDNKSTNVLTDKNGMYKVKVKQNATIIGIMELSSGLVSDNINGHTEINFKLDIATQQAQTAVLDSPNDEVVNIGYGVAQRKNLTSNVATIDGQNVKYASYQSIYDLIKGEVAGVQVIGNKIIIRGVGTINGSTDPLFLIDGMETQSLDAISPRSVKSITVLKGADASIYGSRGANGVIMITLVR